MVIIRTTFGELKLELDAEKAPKTVDNFLQYARDGFYDGTNFSPRHRQLHDPGWGFDTGFEQKSTREPVENEADNGLKNDFGTIAMARTMEPHSATAQFFINVKDNDFLNHSGKNMQGWGYTVFGKVTEGSDVLDKIAPAYRQPWWTPDVPTDDVIIESVEVVEASVPAARTRNLVPRSYFISDLHLTPHRPRVTGAFARFSSKTVTATRSIYWAIFLMPGLAMTTTAPWLSRSGNF